MKAFTAGAMASWGALRGLHKIAMSDTTVGRETRKKVFAKMDHDDLLRMEREISLEVMRRREQKEPEVK